jgi:NAD(P)H-dependent flavin oxidoreductase YrpB (nitropropane dioxygenase family)
MSTDLQRQFGMSVPVWGFSYEPPVVAAISREGGFGVLGCIRYGGDADEMAEAIRYIQKESGGRPFGVNVVMPVSSRQVDADLTNLEAKLEELIPQEHRDFVERFLQEHDVPPLSDDSDLRGVLGWTPQTGQVQLEVAFEFDIALLASALGPPPEEAIREAHARDIPVSALVGRVDQALKQRAQGVDIIVAQGTEAGGHTGQIGGMVLTPEVVDAVAPAPVLHAGGVANGRQLAAALALGAQGAWTGSVWLASQELALDPGLQQMIIDAEAADTVRSRSLTGKPARQLRTAWIEAWESPDTPDPLPMPLQYLLTNEANARFRAAGRWDLVGTPGGQVLGQLDRIRSVKQILDEFRGQAADAVTAVEQGLEG